MTALELARLARGIVPPVGTTGWRIADGGDGPDGRVIWHVVPILFGRVDGAPVFRGRAADARALFRILAGDEPASRATPDVGPGSKPSGVPADQGADALAGDSSDGGSPETERAIASASPGLSERLCAGCGEPLPAGARPNRTTCSGRCRIEAARRRGTVSRRRVTPSTAVTVSPDQRASDALRPLPEPAAPSRPLGSGRSEESAPVDAGTQLTAFAPA